MYVGFWTSQNDHKFEVIPASATSRESDSVELDTYTFIFWTIVKARQVSQNDESLKSHSHKRSALGIRLHRLYVHTLRFRTSRNDTTASHSRECNESGIILHSYMFTHSDSGHSRNDGNLKSHSRERSDSGIGLLRFWFLDHRKSEASQPE